MNKFTDQVPKNNTVKISSIYGEIFHEQANFFHEPGEGGVGGEGDRLHQRKVAIKTRKTGKLDWLQ